jgi:uncharacterized protein YcbK (DUF882 family)
MSKPYFSAHELRCRCDRAECDAEPISIDVLMRANTLRALYGKPLDVSSARRCRYHNDNMKPKGAKNSQHVKGGAIDFLCYDQKMQEKLLELAEKVGFGGIFRYDWGIHVDIGPANRRGDYRQRKKG